ncbi:UNVERIFIED_CONTAM: hypothetical protein GTU68_057349 [Idotea baltica]|nr:hypothetical protein [Idotea baltica]
MSVIPVAFSLMASFMSAITILGVSKEIYSFGTQFILINISYIISTPIVCYIFLPVFYRLKKISVYEYLEMRFGRVTRLFASLAFSLQMTLYMGIVLYAPSLALAAVTGISETWSIIAVGVVCTFYSSIGGMKAVLITDVFQSLLMFAAVFAVGITGLFDFGLAEILNAAAEGDRLEFFNIEVDPRVRHTVWSLGIGGVFTYCSLYGVNQAQVQRLLTVRSLKKAQGSLWLQWIILMCLSLSTSFSGLVLYAQYRSCDPLLSKQISNTDQYGILCMCIAFMSQYLGTGILQASLTIFGAVGGPLLSVFTLGMLSKTANQKGAVMGLIVGLSLTLWIGFGQPKPSPPYKPRSIDGCPSNFNLTVAPNGIAAPSLPKDSLLMDPSNTSLASELDDSASLDTMDTNEDR